MIRQNMYFSLQLQGAEGCLAYLAISRKNADQLYSLSEHGGEVEEKAMSICCFPNVYAATIPSEGATKKHRSVDLRPNKIPLRHGEVFKPNRGRSYFRYSCDGIPVFDDPANPDFFHLHTYLATNCYFDTWDRSSPVIMFTESFVDEEDFAHLLALRKKYDDSKHVIKTPEDDSEQVSTEDCICKDIIDQSVYSLAPKEKTKRGVCKSLSSQIETADRFIFQNFPHSTKIKSVLKISGENAVVRCIHQEAFNPANDSHSQLLDNIEEEWRCCEASVSVKPSELN